MNKWKIELAGYAWDYVGDIIFEAGEWRSEIGGVVWDCWEDLTERIADNPEGGKWDGWRWTPA